MKTKIWHPELSVISPYARIGDGCTIHAPVWIGPNVVIGVGSKVQAFAFIPEGVRMGARCFIGPHACFTNDRYPPSDRWEETILGDDVVIGAGAVILPGLTIGDGAAVAAGATVVGDVPRGELVVGVWRGPQY